MEDLGWAGRGIRVWVLVVVFALLGACTAAPLAPSSVPSPTASGSVTSSDPADSQSPSPTIEPTPAAAAAGGLALTRPVAGVREVFVIDPSGQARQVSGLAEPTSFDVVRPLWSPDRTQIAFLPRAIGSGIDSHLWLVRADGSGQRPIADVGESISWSPDSSRILFQDSVVTTDTTREPARIWIVDGASGKVTQFGSGDLPAWLPSGEEISYVPVRRGPQTDVFPIVVAPLSGGEPREVAHARGAWWSPDGSALLLEQEDGLYIADVDGSGLTRLVAGASPVWSPDGSRVVFAYDHTADALPIIGVVNRDGQVIWSDVVGSEPTWSPDGTRLAVEVGYPETSIQVLDAGDGTVLLELEGQDPAW